MNWAAETEAAEELKTPVSPVKNKTDWTQLPSEEQKQLLPIIPEVIEDYDEFEIPEPVIIPGANDTFIKYSWTFEIDPKASPDDENPDEVLFQTTEHMKRIYHKVNKKVASRRRWQKYGMSENDPEGPSRQTTTMSGDDVPIIFSNRKHIVHNQAVTLNESEEQELKEMQRTIISQLKSNKLTKDKAPANWGKETTAVPTADGKTSFMSLVRDRAGVSTEPGSPAMGASGLRRQGDELASRPGRPHSNYSQEEGCTVRVTNFTENMVEGDFQELFGKMGTVKRIFLARDKRTQRSKGFAYITMERPTEADKAVRFLNKFLLDHLVLQVELSRKDKT